MSNEKKNDMLASMLEQYAKSTAPRQTKGTTYNEKNYLSTYLPKGETNLIKRVRVLATSDGTSPFIEVHLHKIEVDGKKRTFTCLKKQNNEACPFCETRMQLLSSGDEGHKELAKPYNERKHWVVKVIDRDAPEDGPKFWRFADNYKKDGVYDKIMANVRMLNKDIADTETGRDLMLNIDLVPGAGGRKPYGAITSVMCDEPSKLSEDSEQSDAWLADEKVWTDVYSTKNYDYLQIIVEGGVPVFSKELDKFVKKGSADDTYTKTDASKDLDSEIEIGSKQVKETAETKVEPLENTYVADVDVEDDSDDLPF